MTTTFDATVTAEGENFRITPVSKFAREWFNLKYCGSETMPVQSILVDGIELGRLIRWFDGAGAKMFMH